jgi:lipoate-protein ligase A
MPDRWSAEERVGEASALHADWPTVSARPGLPAVAVCQVTTPAVVLGSTQSPSVVDAERAAAAGVAVCNRRSGGGAVLVVPGDPVWIDVWVPAGDVLWRDDVARAFDWLGDTWVEALQRVGIGSLAAHRQGTVSCTPWSSLVCFGGVGTGEVVTADGRKVVGLAQRRNRLGAWFHGACVLRWDPSPLVDVLALSPEDRDAAQAGLAPVVAGALDVADESGQPTPSGSDIAASLIDRLP